MVVAKHSIDYESLVSAANESRGIILDAVEAANSGHLGMPLGCAEIGAALFGQLLNFDASHPTWINRDRFILSAGHGSAFLYAWLHLAGYGISMEDMGNFRKFGSITPGHPEFNAALGIECTTGPLGQGVANAVGMALSCKKQAALFNRGRRKIIDNRVVCLCGDGCLQEGVANEACALAGHWKLDNLLIIFDANGITMDGRLEKSQTEDTPKKFKAIGFDVFETNGNDLRDFMGTFERARASSTGRPKLIVADTIIGLGIGEVAGTSAAHGASGTKFMAEAKRKLGLPLEKFFISEKTRKFFEDRRRQRQRKYSEWLKIFDAWRAKNPDLEKIFLKNSGASALDGCELSDIAPAGKISTRAAAGAILQKVADRDRRIVTGSADLFSSTCNCIENGGDFSRENPLGRNIYFGVREHAMAAISNGISYGGIFRPSCSTFLVFSDYMRAAMRVAALAKLGTIFILTHDSIAVGEDGPTHQPVETIAALRCMPNFDVVRPADFWETVGAWKLALSNATRPTALILSRQDLPSIDTVDSETKVRGALRGAYVAYGETCPLERIVLASGSELQLAIQAAKHFAGTRVVSMPCMEAFERQPEEYREMILPKSCGGRISIEASATMPWHRYVGQNGIAIGVDDFGCSGQASSVMHKFGITLENLKNSIVKLPPLR
ncbi:MAG: transketolase [Puniceicoccales bacterium]|nr:transketolase [Puniceicoccales bacterium]